MNFNFFIQNKIHFWKDFPTTITLGLPPLSTLRGLREESLLMSAPVNVSPASVNASEWHSILFCFFILWHLCLAVRQFRAWLCCHLCRGTTGTVTKVLTTLPRGPQMSRQVGQVLISIRVKGLALLLEMRDRGIMVTSALFFLCIYVQRVSICPSSGIASSIYRTARTLAQCLCRNVM